MAGCTVYFVVGWRLVRFLIVSVRPVTLILQWFDAGGVGFCADLVYGFVCCCIRQDIIFVIMGWGCVCVQEEVRVISRSVKAPVLIILSFALVAQSVYRLFEERELALAGEFLYCSFTACSRDLVGKVFKVYGLQWSASSRVLGAFAAAVRGKALFEIIRPAGI